MITKGIIKSIDLTGNTCTVRLPLFETAGNDPIIETATISNTPGNYNGYKVDDVVWIGFENGMMNTPVVIGKLYLGVEAEKADPRGVLNVEESSISKKASLPADASLEASFDSNVPNTTVPFTSLSSIANNLNTLNTNVGQMDRDYGNRFKQVITDIGTQGEELVTKIEQNAESIKLEAAARTQGDSDTLDAANSALSVEATKIRGEVNAIKESLNGTIESNYSELEQKANEINARVTAVKTELDGKITETNSNLQLKTDEINAEVSTKVSSNSGTAEQAFGWNLKSDEWIVYNKTTEEATSVADLWVDIVQKVVKVEETAEDGTTIEKDIVKQYYAINNIITTREVGTETSLPTIESTGDNTAPWAWADTGSIIKVLNESNADISLNNVKKVKKVLIANKDGLEVRGTIEAKDGHIGSFTIGNKGEDGHSGIYSDNYITKYNEDPGTKTGVYVGTDGIKLGDKFSVDNEGNVTATGLRADKITVKNGNDILLSANDIDYSTENQVIIGGFKVDADKLYSESHSEIGDTTKGIYLGSDGLSIGSGFKVMAGGSPSIAGYIKTSHKKYCRIAEDNASTAETNHKTWWKDWNPTTESGDNYIVWQNTIPDREDGKYIWEWTKDEMGNSTTDINTWEDKGKVCITGAVGATGATGASVTECKTYYSLSNTTSTTGPATGDANIVTTPTVNKWSTSPQAFNKNSHQGYVYWTVERRVYTNPSSVVWGTPVKASMLSVDFIDSLGITAKKITVTDSNSEKLFEADGRSGAGSVSIANFTVANNKIYSDNKSAIDSDANGVYIGTDGISLGKGNFVATNTGQVTIKGYVKSVLRKYRKIEYDKESDIPSSVTDWDNWDSTNWQTTIPSREDGKYIWEWTKEEQGDDSLVDKGKVCITGAAGSSGQPGTSVESVTKYYKLAASKPNKPTNKEPADWSTTPPSWEDGNNYYESDRTLYDNDTFTWSDVIENSMLTVDFINSLGITAKKITVKDSNNKVVFLADASTTTEGSNIKIGGFNVDENSIKNGSLGGANSVMMCTGSTDSASIGGSGSQSGWAFAAGNAFGVLNTGAVYASNMNIDGGRLKIGDSSNYVSISNSWSGQIKLFQSGSNSPATTYGAGDITVVSANDFTIKEKCKAGSQGSASWNEGNYNAGITFKAGNPDIAGPYTSDNLYWKQGINLHTYYPSSSLGNPENYTSLWLGFKYKDYEVADHGFAGDAWCESGYFLSKKGMSNVVDVSSRYLGQHIGFKHGYTDDMETDSHKDVYCGIFSKILCAVGTYSHSVSNLGSAPGLVGNHGAVITKTYKSGDTYIVRFYKDSDWGDCGIEYLIIGVIDDSYMEDNSSYPDIKTY